MKRAMLMSSSRMGNLGYLEHADEQLHTILSGYTKDILFIPYAAVSFSFDTYESIVAPVFERLGYNLRSIHHNRNPKSEIRNAEAIAIGGGNTFALLKRMYDNGLVGLISEQVNHNHTPYVGWSAGTNVACPTIRTTNDMPVVEPPSLDSLSILPIQVNPHFISGKPAGHNGESREERLEEFLTINPGEKLIAIVEGTAIYIEGDQFTIMGDFDGLNFTSPKDHDPLLTGKTYNFTKDL